MDKRWERALVGLRAELYMNSVGRREIGSEGEITGFSHSGYFVWVVFDGEEDAVQLRWNEVRPA